MANFEQHHTISAGPGDAKKRDTLAALAANAKVIVSYDHDLSALEKPFGILVMRPAAFLAWMEDRA